jgi:glutamate-5-semialdehyde dehydrogenase
MDIKQQIIELAVKARDASRAMAKVDSERKNRVLHDMARMLREQKAQLQAENGKDLKAAAGQGLSAAFVDRLTLSDKVIESMAAGLEEVARLPDPVGEVTRMWKRPNGLQVGKMRIPLGVIGMIYESRPNVTIDAGSLCLKSGNAVLLRGGKESINSNLALAAIMQAALEKENIPAAAVQVIPTADRAAVMEMLQLNDYIDIIIPRGGESLIKTVYENSKIPVIAHYKGVCHVYIDESAEYAMAEKIALNSKVQRPGVCNAMETLLVHEKFAAAYLKKLLDSFRAEKVSLKGCAQTRTLDAAVLPAAEQDWYEKYLELTLSVKVVKSMDEAMDHIAKYGSKHTEAIVTANYDHARRFLAEVDSSVVLVNASTRFNDGGQLGLGAEIGISTSKLHSFGPMGLEELTTTKFIVYGEGQVRQ